MDFEKNHIIELLILTNFKKIYSYNLIIRRYGEIWKDMEKVETGIFRRWSVVSSNSYGYHFMTMTVINLAIIY